MVTFCTRPMDLSSGSQCHFVCGKKKSTFSFSEPTYAFTSLLVPSSLDMACKRNEGWNPGWARRLHFCKLTQRSSTGEAAYFARTWRKPHMSARWDAFLVTSCHCHVIPHWQGGLCHTLDCNGTNAARDTAYCAFLPACWTLASQLCKTGLSMHNP